MRFDIVLVDDFEEHVHYLTFDIGTHLHKLAIDPVQNSFEIIALSRVFTVEEFQETVDKVVADVFRNYVVAQIWRQDKFKEQFVDELNVRPGLL